MNRGKRRKVASALIRWNIEEQKVKACGGLMAISLIESVILVFLTIRLKGTKLTTCVVKKEYGKYFTKHINSHKKMHLFKLSLPI